MTDIPFELEERYKVMDPEATQRQLIAAGFMLTHTESQIDHWFIPKSIMSPQEQYHWFDYEAGYAIRVREKTTAQDSRTIITAKQLVIPGDHSTMTNHEDELTVAGTRKVLSAVGEEFKPILDDLSERRADEVVSFQELKRYMDTVGRKEYITLKKERTSFRNPAVQDVVVDLDIIPDLDGTSLGYYASLELEYTGSDSTEHARKVVRDASQSLGFSEDEVLAKALPGQAIPFLAKF